MSQSPSKPQTNPPNSPLPIEVEVYIDPDGTVTFADLEASLIPIVRWLNPDDPLGCDVPGVGPETSARLLGDRHGDDGPS